MIYSTVQNGSKTQLVRLEAQKTSGYCGIQLLGNVSEVIRDGKERAKAALESIGEKFPAQKIIISISPADVMKTGNQLDLAIAASLFQLIHPKESALFSSKDSRWVWAAELGLDGSLNPANNLMCSALEALDQKMTGIIISSKDVAQIESFQHATKTHPHKLEVLAFDNMAQIIGVAKELEEAHSFQVISEDKPLIAASRDVSFHDMVLSADLVKLASVVAVGQHSILLRGTPGSGKSMFAGRLISLMDSMSHQLHIDAMKIYAHMNETIPDHILSGLPPVRRPHHQSSRSALIGSAFQPGEISLAHGGILFLDELAEFRRDALEALREPLENKKILVSRSQSKTWWPADFLFVATMNLCPCGWYGSKKKMCHCSYNKIKNYQFKISGPIHDRIDIAYPMPEFTSSLKNFSQRPPKNSQPISIKAQRMAEFMHKRNKPYHVAHNSKITNELILEACFGNNLSTYENNKLNQLSMRSVGKTLRVARSLADFDQSDFVLNQHLDQALLWSHNPDMSGLVD